METNTAITKSEFSGLVARITSALEQADAVYPPMIAQAAQFDRQLAAKIAKAAEADAELLQYIRSKAERGEGNRGFLATVGALLLGR